MHAYFRNHQLYLAEKSQWMDRHVVKTSKRALIKIESWKLIAQSGEYDDQVKLLEKMVKDSLLTSIDADQILYKEGYHLYNLNN